MHLVFHKTLAKEGSLRQENGRKMARRYGKGTIKL